MTFLERADTLIDKLKKIQSLQANAEEARALKKDAQECKDQNVILNSLSCLIMKCKRNGIPLPRLSRNDAVVNDISGLLGKFKEQPKRETLVRGNKLTRIYDKVQDVQKSTRNVIEGAWRQYCEIHFALQNPVELETTVAQTDENKKLLAEYKAIFLKMSPMLSLLPDADFDFGKLNELHEQLGAILRNVDFNVPEEVKAFLNAIAETQGAPLSYLTNPVVIEWLQNHNQMERYKIIRRI